MDIIFSVISGIVQGLTEFLPISSSGHLVLLHDFFGFNLSDDIAFDVMLHVATMCSLLLFFWQDVLKLIKSFFQSIVARDSTDPYQRLSWYLVIGTIPAVIVGFFFEQQIEDLFRSITMVAIMLTVFGVLLYVADVYSAKLRSLNDVKLQDGIIVGLAQAVALIPGVSRSGITIIAGLSQKLKRADAARFSFLLSMPVVFGAGSKKIVDLVSAGGVPSGEGVMISLGFISALITGYFCIKYFLLFLQNHSLRVFAYYRIALGLGILFFLYVL